LISKNFSKAVRSELFPAKEISPSALLM